MSIITEVKKSSPFINKLLPGDELISVNGKTICDILDYMYHSADENISLLVNRNGKEISFTAKNTGGDLGLTFDSFLMDKNKSCKNKCIFCFIDQLPKNMRETMYYKDDDFRLSLLQGNYVTLTNLSETDILRIGRLRISPLNISVHATDEDIRVRMMKNPNAGNIMNLLRFFSESGISMKCQIVLCKGFNDGEILKKSLFDLKSLHLSVSSVSIVPVGLSKHREELEKLELFSPDECSEIIDIIDSFGDKCVEEYGTRIFYGADELYLKSKKKIPSPKYYEDFEQIENGVGMLSSFIYEFDAALREKPVNKKSGRLAFVSGKIMESVLPLQFKKLEEKLPNLEYSLHFIENDYFGENITVTGLVTGKDIISQLRGKLNCDCLVIPSVMLRDDKFLDDVSVRDVEKELGVHVLASPCGGAELAEFLFGV